MMPEYWQVKDRRQAELFKEHVDYCLGQGKAMTYQIYEGLRTTPQNNALHGLLRRMSTALNDAGIEGPAHPWREDFRLDWSPELCKSLLFHPVMQAMTGKQSSSQLTKSELSNAVEQMLRRVTEVTGVYVDGLEFRNG